MERVEAAKQDLLQIVDDARVRASPGSAERLLDGVLECIASLEQWPDRGSTPGEPAALGIREFRQLIFQTYRLICRVVGRTLFILVIADGRQDMNRSLEQRLFGR